MKSSYIIPSLAFVLIFISCHSEDYSCNDHKSKKAFEFEFGDLSAHNVKNICFKQILMGDSYRSWLKFDESYSAFENRRIKFELISVDEFELHSGGKNTPSWWKISKKSDVKFYGLKAWKKDFAYSYAVLYHDITENVVYFCHDCEP